MKHLQKKGIKAGLLSTDDYNNTDFNWPAKYRTEDGKYIDFSNKEANAFFYKTVYDFYSPDTLDKQQLISDINSINRGQTIIGKLNKLASGNQEPSKIEGSSHIIIEGCHALMSEEINNKADLKIYCEVDDDLRLAWKIMRSPYYKKMVGETPQDRRNFGGELKRSFEQWFKSIRHSHKNFIEPSKNNADLIVSYENWEQFDKELNKVTKLVDLYFKSQGEFNKELEKLKSQNSPQQIVKLVTKEVQVPASKESLWKQTSTYLMFVGGFVLAGLIGLGIYYWMRRKPKH